MITWANVLLVIKNWKYVVQFVEILDQAIQRGANERDLKIGLDRLNKGFANARTVKDSADSARNINDSFRK